MDCQFDDNKTPGMSQDTCDARTLQIDSSSQAECWFSAVAYPVVLRSSAFVINERYESSEVQDQLILYSCSNGLDLHWLIPAKCLKSDYDGAQGWRTKKNWFSRPNIQTTSYFQMIYSTFVGQSRECSTWPSWYQLIGGWAEGWYKIQDTSLEYGEACATKALISFLESEPQTTIYWVSLKWLKSADTSSYVAARKVDLEDEVSAWWFNLAIGYNCDTLPMYIFLLVVREPFWYDWKGDVLNHQCLLANCQIIQNLLPGISRKWVVGLWFFGFNCSILAGTPSISTFEIQFLGTWGPWVAFMMFIHHFRGLRSPPALHFTKAMACKQMCSNDPRLDRQRLQGSNGKEKCSWSGQKQEPGWEALRNIDMMELKSPQCSEERECSSMWLSNAIAAWKCVDCLSYWPIPNPSR